MPVRHEYIFIFMLAALRAVPVPVVSFAALRAALGTPKIPKQGVPAGPPYRIPTHPKYLKYLKYLGKKNNTW